jgi:dipeptidyl aminopeptidase/acylaminoacyl peptidase
VIDQQSVERAAERFRLSDGSFERLVRRRDRKHRNERIAAGVVGIAVFVAAVWIVMSVGSVDRTRTPAVPGGAETGPTPTPPAQTALRSGYLIDLNTGEMTPLPKSIAGVGYSVSPEGTMVAYASPDDAGALQVFIANLDGAHVEQVTHDPRQAYSPDWSPDGEAIAFTGSSGDGGFHNIFVLDLVTGETSQVTNETPATDPYLRIGAGFPQFSPDGASIVYQVHRGEGMSVRIVPVTGGESVLLVGGGKNDVQAWLPAFSPDGSTLAVGCSGPRLEGICIADADGTNLRELVSGDRVGPPEWSPDGTRIAYTIRERAFVVDVATGETTFVNEGIAAEWLDDHTLIIEREGE